MRHIFALKYEATGEGGMYETQGMKQFEPWEIRITSPDGQSWLGAKQEELLSTEECRSLWQVQNDHGTGGTGVSI